MRRWLSLATVVFVIDQLSKWLILQTFVPGSSMPVIPGLNLQLAFNTGAAFGFLANSSGWQQLFFIGMAILVSISIIFWLKKLTKQEFLDGLALASILGGALGNLVDRIRFGYVIDFIDVYYNTAWHWYTFNLADAAICAGTALLMFTLLKQTRASQ